MNKFYVREICQDDLVYLNKWRNDREVIDCLGSPFRFVSPKVDESWLANYHANRGYAVRLAICEATSHILIGAVYLLSIDWVSRSSEFAIWIGEKSSQGQGAGLFATREALRHAFLDLNLNRIYLTVLEDNARALALYKKVGFKVEGALRQAVFKNGKYFDMTQMSILADDYRSFGQVDI